ncbi:6873_t:CDS:2 [Paraglomus brasilianum]|uniref:6873_t:CDS:1 n=1 Tax=Paraglomus brasilianum TaxID=144538 RepID=A0A9N8VYF5_9GLOM|nr:6873_t:CDS:2 [Paraglomus brasilianum]
MGYLTATNTKLDPESDGPKELHVPNKEVMNEWEVHVVMKQMSIFNIGGSKSGKKAEDFYHGFVLGLLTEATK